MQTFYIKLVKRWRGIKVSSLTEVEKKRIDDLLLKLKEKRLEKQEGHELQRLLERRKEEAFNTGNFLLGVGAILFGAVLISYLTEVNIGEDIKLGENLSAEKIPKKKS
jgi:hypothetical protein